VKSALWALIPTALVAGIVGGLIIRGQQVKTVTTTVVQIQTVAPPPPATKHLTAYIEADNSGSCLTANTDYSNLGQDTWTLRDESNGLNSGSVLATEDGAEMDSQGCYLLVHFSLSPNLGFFYVHDDSKDDVWGPFDSHKLKTSNYQLRLWFR
jgi:hypothetical protein